MVRLKRIDSIRISATFSICLSDRIFSFPVCKMSFERFDEARNSYGTDEDLIFVAAVNEE